MKKDIFALISMVIGLILILVSLFGPWYSISITNSENDTDYSQDSYLTKMETKGKLFGYDITNSSSYADAGNFEGKHIFDNTMYLTIGVLFASILAFIGLLGVMFHFGKTNTVRKICALFGIITFILAVMTISYFMVEFTNQAEETASTYSEISGEETLDIGFWFSKSSEGSKISTGPGYSWYLMIIAGIITLIFPVILLIKQKPTTETSS